MRLHAPSSVASPSWNWKWSFFFWLPLLAGDFEHFHQCFIAGDLELPSILPTAIPEDLFGTVHARLFFLLESTKANIQKTKKKPVSGNHVENNRISYFISYHPCICVCPWNEPVLNVDSMGLWDMLEESPPQEEPVAVTLVQTSRRLVDCATFSQKNTYQLPVIFSCNQR